MTGEMSIHGKVKPIGGVIAKVEAAFQAGATRVIIPKDNWQSLFQDLSGGLRVIPVETVDEVFRQVFGGSLAADIVELPNTDIYPASSASLLQATPPRNGKMTDAGGV